MNKVIETDTYSLRFIHIAGTYSFFGGSYVARAFAFFAELVDDEVIGHYYVSAVIDSEIFQIRAVCFHFRHFFKH